MVDVVTLNSGLDEVLLQRIVLRNINGAGTGSAQLGTIPASRIFLPTQVVIGAQAPNAITTVPTVSIGTNGPNYNNVVAATSLTGLVGGSAIVLPLRSPMAILNGGDVVFGRISIAGVSTGAITLTLVVLGVWIL